MMRRRGGSRGTGLMLCCLGAGVLIHAAAMAQSAPAKSGSAANREPLEIKLVRNKVAMAGGKESLSSAATAKPGEILQDVATYTNTGKGALSKLEATLPVPANTELLLDSIKPAGALGSTDGKNYQPLPLKRKIRQASGVETEQAIPSAEYRFLKWNASSLPAGSALVFSARFKVLDEVPVPAAGAAKQ